MVIFWLSTTVFLKTIKISWIPSIISYKYSQKEHFPQKRLINIELDLQEKSQIFFIRIMILSDSLSKMQFSNEDH